MIGLMVSLFVFFCWYDQACINVTMLFTTKTASEQVKMNSWVLKLIVNKDVCWEIVWFCNERATLRNWRPFDFLVRKKELMILFGSGAMIGADIRRIDIATNKCSKPK